MKGRSYEETEIPIEDKKSERNKKIDKITRIQPPKSF